MNLARRAARCSEASDVLLCGGPHTLCALQSQPPTSLPSLTDLTLTVTCPPRCRLWLTSDPVTGRVRNCGTMPSSEQVEQQPQPSSIQQPCANQACTVRTQDAARNIPHAHTARTLRVTRIPIQQGRWSSSTTGAHIHTQAREPVHVCSTRWLNASAQCVCLCVCVCTQGPHYDPEYDPSASITVRDRSNGALVAAPGPLCIGKTYTVTVSNKVFIAQRHPCDAAIYVPCSVSCRQATVFICLSGLATDALCCVVSSKALLALGHPCNAARHIAFTQPAETALLLVLRAQNNSVCAAD